MSDDPQAKQPHSALLAPGDRLGWVFRDRNQFRQEFSEPTPDPPEKPLVLMDKVAKARARLLERMRTASAVGAIVAVVASCYIGDSGSLSSILALLATSALLGALGGTSIVVGWYLSMKRKVEAANKERQRWYDEARATWAERRDAFVREDRMRVEKLPEWGAVSPGPHGRRVDIVGGNLWGWEALLTVFGGSLLSTHGPIALVDLSGEAVSRELLRVADANGVTIDMLLMPDELGESDLLVGLSARELVDALIESFYSDDKPADRVGRALDDRILTSVCAALGEDLSMSRISAALRVLMNEPGETPVLTTEERRMVAEELFGDEYRRQAHQNLVRLESFIHPLGALGTRRQARAAAILTCLALRTDGRNVRNELLTDLIVQWLIRRIVRGATELGSLIIAGADDIPARHLERLSDLCERREVRLVLMFRHLRGQATQAIGGGAVGFMRLGNHEEARQAAEFIGRDHHFVLSQLTRTLSGNETHTTADTDGGGTTDGKSETTTKTRTLGTTTRAGPLGWWFTASSRTSDRSRTKSWSRSETRNWSVTRNWSRTRSLAEGTSWSDAAVEQRVYEYTVEPRELQNLPDYAMLLVRRDTDDTEVVSVDCNPDIVTLPRVSMDPLPDMPMPQGARPPAGPALASSPHEALTSPKIDTPATAGLPRSGPPLPRVPVPLPRRPRQPRRPRPQLLQPAADAPDDRQTPQRP